MKFENVKNLKIGALVYVGGTPYVFVGNDEFLPLTTIYEIMYRKHLIANTQKMSDVNDGVRQQLADTKGLVIVSDFTMRFALECIDSTMTMNGKKAISRGDVVIVYGMPRAYCVLDGSDDYDLVLVPLECIEYGYLARKVVIPRRLCCATGDFVYGYLLENLRYVR